MTAWENISFPLQAQGLKRDEINQRVQQVSELLQITHLLKLRPGSLSGGDQQRVALARALVRQPAAFLMDEPLGALDADFREQMRVEIKKLHINLHATTVYVTHDQVEAMAMSDRIVVMSNAAIQQIGTPSDVYYNPANLFVANFIGSPGMNLIKGRYSEGKIHMPGNHTFQIPDIWQASIDRQIQANGEIVLGFRPESGSLKAQGDLNAEVYAVDMNGSDSLLYMSLGDHQIIRIRTDRSVRAPIGTSVNISIDPEYVRFFDARTEATLVREDLS
jgi:multiple sugar transport system ATP-binding protein